MDEHITPEEMQNTYENESVQETAQTEQEPQEVPAAPAEQAEAQEVSEEVPEAVEEVQEASESSEETAEPTEQETVPQRRRRRVVLDDSDYDLIRGGNRAQTIAYYTNAQRRRSRLTGTVVKTEEVEGLEPNKVIDVLQKGYIYKDKVIRHAMVKVSK